MRIGLVHQRLEIVQIIRPGGSGGVNGICLSAGPNDGLMLQGFDTTVEAAAREDVAQGFWGDDRVMEARRERRDEGVDVR